MPFRTVAAGVLRPAGADALQDDAGTARGDPNLLAGGESAADQQCGEWLLDRVDQQSAQGLWPVQHAAGQMVARPVGECEPDAPCGGPCGQGG